MQAIMSRDRRFVEIEAPSVLMTTEKIESRGYRCNYCSGNGYFWDRDCIGDPIRHACPFCNGAGEVDAVVTITWIPKETKK